MKTILQYKNWFFILFFALSINALGQYTGGSPDIAAYKTATASCYTSAGYLPANATNRADGYWTCHQVAPNELIVDLGGNYYINGYGMALPISVEIPKGYYIYVSADNSNWSYITSGTNSTSGTFTYNISSTGPWRYVKLYIHTKDYYGSVDEFYVYGTITPSTPTISSFTPTTAAAGATVTITGTNFTDATAVSFGGTAAASFSVVSATSITAVVASGTTGSVSVTTPGGTVSLAGFTFAMVPPGNALAFDGVNDYVQINNPYNGFTNSITVDFWAKINMADCSINGLLGQSVSGSDNMSTNVWIIEIIQAANSLYFYVNDNGTWRSVSTSGNFPTPGWHHWVATSNSTSTNLYLDGTLINTSAGISSGIRSSPSSVIHIGKEVRYSSGRFIKGSFDEVRIWNIAKTQSEVQSTMYSELVGNESGLVAYYNFNQGIAGGDNSGITALNDLTSNGRNGTLTNFTKTGTTSNFVESYALVVAVPAAATNITGTGFTANWTAPAVGTVTSYLLDVSTSSTFGSFVTGYAALDCGTSLSQAVSGLTAGSTYYYRVRADKTSVTGTGGYYRTPTTVTTSCTNPTSGGTIAADQTICSGLVPAAFTSSAAASGNTGTLEYKWQLSTTSSSSGFNDIASSNSETFTPGTLTATTWYKRLSKVTCDVIWPVAGESNVLEITVNQPSFSPGTFTVANLQATGTNIQWYAAGSGGTAMASGDVISNGTTYYASQTVNGVESTQRLGVAATIDPTPCAPTGSATQTYSAGATVASLQATGSNIRWYAAASGGTSLATSTVLVNGTHYYATQTISCTESATRLEVVVTIN